MDILDRLLAFAQLSAGISVKCRLQGDWQLENSHQSGQAVAHIINEGQAYLEHNGKTHALKQGDIVLFPRFAEHILRSQTEPVTFKETINHKAQGAFTLKTAGKAQPECDMFCLHFYYDRQAELMESLPEMLIFQVGNTPIKAMLEVLKQEAESPNLAVKSVVNSLAVVILTMILREHLVQNNQLFGILKGWQDLRLRPLIKAILQSPEQAWQVDDMAAFIHLSRSQLVRLFNKHLCISPHAFVHKIRLQKAAMLLKNQSGSVLSIALSCGFQSEPHFITAFKKRYCITPSQYRQLNS